MVICISIFTNHHLILQQIQPTAAELSELQQSTSDQRHLQQTYQKLQHQLITKTKPLILTNAQPVSLILK